MSRHEQGEGGPLHRWTSWCRVSDHLGEEVALTGEWPGPTEPRLGRGVSCVGSRMAELRWRKGSIGL